MREGWASNQGTRLHYLESGSEGLPLVFLPGTFGFAEDYVPEMSALAPRRCIAVSLRGRGKSDAAESGYAFDDHVGDFAAIVAHVGLARCAVMAYSMGVPWALGYALREVRRVAGLVLGDYPARYRALAPGWASRAVSAMPQRANPAVARALERDSAEVLLWDRLGELRCPVLILRGGQPGAMVTDEVAERYGRHLAQMTVVTIDRNGRELWQPDFDAYIGAVATFLGTLDTAPR